MKLKKRIGTTLVSLSMIISCGIAPLAKAGTAGQIAFCMFVASLVCGGDDGCWDEVYLECRDSFKTITNKPKPTCPFETCPA